MSVVFGGGPGLVAGLLEQDEPDLLTDLIHLGEDACEAAAVGDPLLVGVNGRGPRTGPGAWVRGLFSGRDWRLVERTGRCVTLTPAGERLWTELDPAYAGLLDVLERFAREHQPSAGVIRLGVTHAAAASPDLPRAISTFETRHPQSSVEIVELPFRDRLWPVRRGEIDLMVLRLPVEQPDIQVGPVVRREARVLAVGRHYPLAARESVSIEDVAEHSVVDVSGLGPREIGAAYVPEVTPAGRPIPRLTATVHDFTDLVLLIARGRALQPTVASAAPRFAHHDVVRLPITDLPPSRTALGWWRGNSDPRLHAFVEVAREFLRAGSAIEPAL